MQVVKYMAPVYQSSRRGLDRACGGWSMDGKERGKETERAASAVAEASYRDGLIRYSNPGVNWNQWKLKPISCCPLVIESTTQLLTQAARQRASLGTMSLFHSSLLMSTQHLL
jgi:hypothetical protein